MKLLLTTCETKTDAEGGQTICFHDEELSLKYHLLQQTCVIQPKTARKLLKME
jgi:hypothetical protein